MRILLSGSTGFIGSNLKSFLTYQGHSVFCLVRTLTANKEDLYVNYQDLPDNLSYFEGFDACIHLVGENLAEGRWTKKKKERILESRVKTTQFLVYLFKNLTHPPKKFLCASALGYYGDKGEKIQREDSSSGNSFLAYVCREWEREAGLAAELGIQVISFRMGAVLAKDGGFLKKLYPIFRLGLGAKLGTGEQYVSWIYLKDLEQALLFLLKRSDIEGAVNLASPYPLQQKEFASYLAKALHRPHFFSLPSWLLKLFFSEMAEEILLASTRAYPEKLLKYGFHFQFPLLEQALADIYAS